MLGYKVPDAAALAEGTIPPWGHITCGGTVANIEAVWSARNLKFYPIAFQQALQHEESLAAARDIKIFVPELQDEKELNSLKTWQLLNLKSNDILALTSRLNEEYGITSDTVTAAISKYSVQDIGMVSFARKYLTEIEHLRN